MRSKMINMQSVCMCMFENKRFLFRSTLEPHCVASTETIYTSVHPHPSMCHRGLKTSISVGAVDNGFSFYEMKCDRIMYIITNV